MAHTDQPDFSAMGKMLERFDGMPQTVRRDQPSIGSVFPSSNFKARHRTRRELRPVYDKHGKVIRMIED